MISDAASAGLAGINSATQRIGASAHNVANLNTQDFRPLEVRQAVDATDRPRATVERSKEAREVDLTREIVDQLRARIDFEASLRVIEADLETKGMLLDMTI